MLFLRTAVMLFIHEYFFGVGEAHNVVIIRDILCNYFQNGPLCDEWIRQLCMFLADDNLSIKLATLESLGDLSQSLSYADKRSAISQIIYGVRCH